ncbi:hypothetical protein UlMin_028565 [Ulmus minor]
MAEAQFHNSHDQIPPVPDSRPQVLVIPPTMAFKLFESLFSEKFQVLKAFESELPLHQYIATNARSVRALICNDIIPVNAELLRQLPALQIAASTATGVDNIDLIECRRRGIAVTNSAGAHSEDVADMAMGLLIDVLRGVSAADRYVRSGTWKNNGDYRLGFKLSGKRVGIIGLGRIGSEVVKRLSAFGCSVSYNSRNKKPFVPYPFYSSVRELAANSDAIIVCCALTGETHHIVNKEVLSALGKEGVIVNIGRGALVDEKELVKCLGQGKIGGAGLDVFENEPNVSGELFGLDNVVLSPHRAVFTPESFKAAAELVIGNLQAFFSNKPLLTSLTND